MNPNQFIAHGEPVAINAASSGVDAPLRVRLAPIGDFPLRDGSKRHGAMQHCTREALVEVVENWKREGSPEILVDVDHASALGNGTEAAAWCSELATDADGLNGVLKLTPKGRELVAGRNYRFLSPAWTLSGDGTPVRLVSVALTNTPNLPLPPVVNRSVPAHSCAGITPSTPKENNPMDTKKLAEALGLGADATEEQILAAAADAAKAVKELAALKAKLADADAEQFASNAVKDGKIAANSKDTVKAAYLKDPEGAKAFLNALVKPAEKPAETPPQTVLNAAAATSPAKDPVALNSAIASYRQAHGCDFHTAWEAVRIQKPELF